MNNISIKQGGIFFVDLEPTLGHEQSEFRPVLVLQNNKLNRHLNTVVVAPITSNLKTTGFYLTHFLGKKLSGLKKNSVVLLFQVRSIDIKRLKKYASCIDEQSFKEIKTKLPLLF